jgi:rhodanese-related sulfurtransferase
MKTITAISVVVLLVVFAAVGVGAGYVYGGSGASSHTTTVTSTTTATNTNDLTNYFSQAAASTYGEGWYFVMRTNLVSMLDQDNGSVYVLDVRMAADYANGHVPGAVNVPFPNMTAALLAGQIPQNKIIVVICYVGESAGSTMTVLRLLGYNAYDLEGGMAAWNNATRLAPSYPIAVGENYPMVTGTAPGTWTNFTPTAAGDVI